MSASFKNSEINLACRDGNCKSFFHSKCLSILIDQKFIIHFSLSIFAFIFSISVFGQTNSVTFNSSGTWTVPPGVTQVTVEAWGGGAGGAGNKGNGGGGGAYASSIITISQASYPVVVGAGGTGGSTGGNGGNSIFGSNLVVAAGASGSSGGAASGSTGNVKWSGGNGGSGAGNNGGGGGGSAYSTADGNPGVVVTGGLGTGNGGNGGDGNNIPGVVGFSPGGGGGAGGNKTTSGANGASGRIVISWCPSPDITTQPANQTVTYGNNASFSVSTSATNVSTYQWQENSGSGWTNTGTNSSTLTVTNPTVAMSGRQYRCIVTVDCGSSATSNAATLTVNKKGLTITASNQAKCFGDLFVFSGNEFISAGLVGAETIGSISFTSGGTATTATVGNYSIQPSAATGGTFNANNYQISYVDGQLDVKPLPQLSGASQNAVVCEGETATIHLSGLSPGKTFSLNYSINGIALPQKTGLISDAGGNSSFTTSVLSAANNGQTLQITGITITSETPGCSQSFTQNVILSVNPSSVGGTASSDQSICVNSSPSDITLTGYIGDLQWQSSSDNISFADIPGAVSSTLTGAEMGILSVTTYYQAKATSALCSPAYSNTVTVTVHTQPTITLTQSETDVCYGDAAGSLSFSSPTGSPNQYSIDFDGVAEAEGFSDVSNGVLTGGSIDIAVPADGTPDSYNAMLTVINSATGCVSGLYPITITIHALPQIGNIN